MEILVSVYLFSLSGRIGIIVALEIGVQLGIKEESERFVVFTRMNLFLEGM